MAGSNLTIHTGNYFKVEDITEVRFLNVAEITWANVSNPNELNSVNLTVKENTGNSVWQFNVKDNDSVNTSFKFNVIALYGLADNKDESGNVTDSTRTLLAYGHYRSYQLLISSDLWEIKVSSNWKYTFGKDTVFNTLDMIYGEHAADSESKLSEVHTRLITAGSVPNSNIVSNMVSEYQNKGVDDKSNNGTPTIYGLNIVKYSNKLDSEGNVIPETVANHKAGIAAQWLVTNKLAGLNDILCIYENKVNDIDDNSIYRLTDFIGGV